ncbi:hypothetical protein RIB2604_01705460 [Aspergillus luchuensis]|uniref:Uncharacterized protein n=1 Tax=Aspergillus kawachii TaxID=1069201 RepID=A0A146FC08_ASPKA|nr:hypothetical protein RIB2604_01705460 [Aspergillus luchuensis]
MSSTQRAESRHPQNNTTGKTIRSATSTTPTGRSSESLTGL